MAKGKSQYANWFCTECGKMNKTTAYDKRRNDEIVKELSRFCNQCRAHKEHKRKDAKKSS